MRRMASIEEAAGSEGLAGDSDVAPATLAGVQAGGKIVGCRLLAVGSWSRKGTEGIVLTRNR
jgi:hypothetical protein